MKTINVKIWNVQILKRDAIRLLGFDHIENLILNIIHSELDVLFWYVWKLTIANMVSNILWTLKSDLFGTKISFWNWNHWNYGYLLTVFLFDGSFYSTEEIIDRKRIQITLMPDVEQFEQIHDSLRSTAAVNCKHEIKKMFVIHFAIVDLRTLKHTTDELLRQASVLIPIRKTAQTIQKPSYNMERKLETAS